MGTLAHNPAPVSDNKLTRTEYESLSAHYISSGAIGDVLYYDGTDIVTLPVGSNGQFLTLAAGIPAWTSSIPAGSFPLLAPDGSAVAPSYSFASATGSGLWKITGNILGVTIGGITYFALTGGELRNHATQSVSWSGGDPSSVAADVFLYRDAANVLAQRNSTTAQAHRIYNTFTDASNFERFEMAWGAGPVVALQTTQAGTGASRELILRTVGGAALSFWTTNTARWEIGGGNGHFLARTDNAYDIGASGATRPRDYYGAGKIRLTNNQDIQFRDNAGANWRSAMYLSTSDLLIIGGDGNNAQFGGRIRTVDGSAALPSYAFTTEPDCGFYVSNVNYVSASAGSADRWLFNTTEIRMIAGYQLGWSSNGSNVNSGAADLTLFRDAANTLAQRNGTTPQGSRIYNTWTNGANGEWLDIGWSSDVLYMQTIANGTGTLRSLVIRSGSILQFQAGGGAVAWQIAAAGHFTTSADNTYDIGASGATRPRSIYVGTQFLAPATTAVYSFAGDIDTGFGTPGADVANILTGGTQRVRFDVNGLHVASSINTRSVTNPTNSINIYNGTAPAGTLANGATFYAQAGEMWVMNAAGTPTQLSPHDPDGYWWFNSYTPKGKKLEIDVEKILRFVNDKYGLDMVRELEVAGALG